MQDACEFTTCDCTMRANQSIDCFNDCRTHSVCCRYLEGGTGAQLYIAVMWQCWLLDTVYDSAACMLAADCCAVRAYISHAYAQDHVGIRGVYICVTLCVTVCRCMSPRLAVCRFRLLGRSPDVICSLFALLMVIESCCMLLDVTVISSVILYVTLVCLFVSLYVAVCA